MPITFVHCLHPVWLLSRLHCKDTKLKEAQQGKQESGDEVVVSRWQKATIDYRLKKIKLIMPVDDAVEAILDALLAFLCHVYVKRCQEVAHQQEIEESPAARCVVQIDYAEHYTCASDSIHKSSFGACSWSVGKIREQLCCTFRHV